MAEPIKMRIRDGCRGGQEQFRWNSVKDQDFKDREQYLGQSTRVGTMGKFGRYYLHDWYAKKRDTPESVESEMGAVKAYEEELMQEALGLKPKKLLLAKKQLDEEELKMFLAKEKPEGKQGRAMMGPQKKLVTNEMGEQVAEDDFVGKAYLDSTIKGLGYASHRTAKLEEYKAKTFGTEAKLEGCKEQGLIKVEDDDIVKLGFGQVKSESSSSKVEIKRESDVKSELEDEAKAESSEADRDAGEGSDGRSQKRPRGSDEVKDEVKKEGEDGNDSRRRKGTHDDTKDSKKRKKVEKKMKKAEKKAKKAAKHAKKAAKKAKKKAKKNCSSSSSSSSS